MLEVIESSLLGLVLSNAEKTKQMGLFFAMFLTLANLTFMTVGGLVCVYSSSHAVHIYYLNFLRILLHFAISTFVGHFIAAPSGVEILYSAGRTLLRALNSRTYKTKLDI